MSEKKDPLEQLKDVALLAALTNAQNGIAKSLLAGVKMALLGREDERVRRWAANMATTLEEMANVVRMLIDTSKPLDDVAEKASDYIDSILTKRGVK